MLVVSKFLFHLGEKLFLESIEVELKVFLALLRFNLAFSFSSFTLLDVGTSNKSACHGTNLVVEELKESFLLSCSSLIAVESDLSFGFNLEHGFDQCHVLTKCVEMILD